MSTANGKDIAIAGMFCGGVEEFKTPSGKMLTSAIRKSVVEHINIELDGFVGDTSSEADHHTLAKAIHFMDLGNYARVESELDCVLERPAFGENMLMHGMHENDICVGDVFRIGSAVLSVSQPTERCATLGARAGQPKMLKVLHRLKICGFYMHVVEPGEIAISDRAMLMERPQPDWSILRLHETMFYNLANAGRIDAVLALDQLSDEWKQRLRKLQGRHSRGEALSSSLTDIEFDQQKPT